MKQFITLFVLGATALSTTLSAEEGAEETATIEEELNSAKEIVTQEIHSEIIVSDQLENEVEMAEIELN